MTQLNVAVLTELGFGQVGGAEVASKIIASVNVNYLGNKVLNVTVSRMKESCMDAKVHGSHSPIIKAFYDKPLNEGLMKLKEKLRIELIHANITSARSAFFLSRALCKLRLPLVLTAHNWIYLCPIDYYVMIPELMLCQKTSPSSHCLTCMISITKLRRSSMTELLRSIARIPYNIFAFRQLLNKASCVISPSRNFAMELRRRLGVKTCYIPNPVDSVLLEERPHPEGDGSIAFVGRLEWEKGIHVLMHLAKTLSQVAVHIAGEGSLREWLLEHKPQNVIYHGFLDSEEKFRLMKKASVVVVPSIWSEMFGYTVSEAFCMSKPVVAFDVGGPKEQIEASGGGLLAKVFDLKDLAEKVDYLLQNPSEAKKMGLRGRKWVEKNLHPECYGKALANVYCSAISAV